MQGMERDLRDLRAATHHVDPDAVHLHPRQDPGQRSLMWRLILDRFFRGFLHRYRLESMDGRRVPGFKVVDNED